MKTSLTIGIFILINALNEIDAKPVLLHCIISIVKNLDEIIPNKRNSMVNYSNGLHLKFYMHLKMNTKASWYFNILKSVIQKMKDFF